MGDVYTGAVLTTGQQNVWQGKRLRLLKRLEQRLRK
jgi:hypothetical protein